MRRLKWVALAAAGATSLAATSPAAAAVSLGETFLPPGLFIENGIAVQTESPSNSYAMPTDGVITSWSYQSSAGAAAPPMKLKIVRSAGGTDYTIIGESGFEMPIQAELNTWLTRVSVKAGDLLGVYYSDSTFAFRDTGNPAYEAVDLAPGDDVPPGTTLTFAHPNPGIQLDVAAKLEPDADRDGFGDETQDACPTDATTQGPCPDTDSPETRITKDVKRSETGKVKFRFTSDEAGSTFECSLKGQDLKRRIRQFNDCDSPRKYTNLDEGRFRFKVRAIDAAGNVDLTPAEDGFRVVD